MTLGAVLAPPTTAAAPNEHSHRELSSCAGARRTPRPTLRHDCNRRPPQTPSRRAAARPRANT